MNKNEVNEKILGIIRSILGINKVMTHMDMFTLGIDSISFVEIVVAIENEFQIYFEDEMLIFGRIEKVEDFTNYVVSSLKLENK